MGNTNPTIISGAHSMNQNQQSPVSSCLAVLVQSELTAEGAARSTQEIVTPSGSITYFFMPCSGICRKTKAKRTTR